MNIHSELSKLGKENGNQALAALLGCIADREEMPPEDLLAKAQAMDWDLAWDSIGGPAVDALTEFLNHYVGSYDEA